MLASRFLSRCVVTLETSEAGSEQRIDAAGARIESLFDKLEETGRAFVAPRSQDFALPQLGTDQQSAEICRVELLCEPPLAAEELRTLAIRIAVLLSQLPDVTPRETPAVDRAAHEAEG